MTSENIGIFDQESPEMLQLVAGITEILKGNAIALKQISAGIRESPKDSTIRKNLVDDFLRLSDAVRNLAVALTDLKNNINIIHGSLH